MNYKQELTKAMGKLAEDDRTIFVGQSVEYDGQAAFDTFALVPGFRRLEMPVAEDFQMGFCIGLALNGYIPVCFYPRFDFLLLAMNQLVNHLDKIPEYSDYRPKMIIRTAIGATEPLDAGPQHTQDYSNELGSMLWNTQIFACHRANAICDNYLTALDSETPTIVIEYMSKYNETN